MRYIIQRSTKHGDTDMFAVNQKVKATEKMNFSKRTNDLGIVTFSDEMGAYVTWQSDGKSVFHYHFEIC